MIQSNEQKNVSIKPIRGLEHSNSAGNIEKMLQTTRINTSSHNYSVNKSGMPPLPPPRTKKKLINSTEVSKTSSLYKQN